MNDDPVKAYGVTVRVRKTIFDETIKNIDKEKQAAILNGRLEVRIRLGDVANNRYYNRSEIKNYYEKQGFDCIADKNYTNYLYIRWNMEGTIHEDLGELI